MEISLTITISKHSKQLINELAPVINDSTLQEWNQHIDDELKRSTLLDWLSLSITNEKKSRYLLESLRVSLLQDLLDDLKKSSNQLNKEKGEKKIQSRAWYKNPHFMVLATSGTVLAICEGFDSITSILSMFSAVSMSVMFIAGVISSILSVLVFFGFGLVEISKNLGVKLSKSRHLLDICIEQVEQIVELRKCIDHHYSLVTDVRDHAQLRAMVIMLQARYNDLDDARQAYIKLLNNSYLKAAKITVAILTGLLFFGSGFFFGQSLALMVASIFVVGVSMTFWPVVLASVIVGLAAFSVYWFVERPGLTNIIGRWIGLDQDKISQFADDDMVQEHKEELSNLEEKITHLEHLESKILVLSKFNQLPKLDSQGEQSSLGSESLGSIARNDQSFFSHKRSYSLNDLQVLDEGIDEKESSHRSAGLNS